MRTLTGLLLVLSLIACGDSKADKCRKVRDKMAATMPQKVEESLASVAETDRARLQAEGDKEIRQFNERFVDVCKKTEKLDFACLEDEEKAKTEDCRKVLDPMWKEVYGAK